MFVRSIRWRLQIWYGLILIVVVAGLGFTAYQLERTTLFQRIDEELQFRVSVLARSLPPPPGAEHGNFDPPPHRPPPGMRRSGEFGPSNRPRPDDGPPGEPRGGRPRLHLSARDASLFEERESNPFYYIFWWRDGEQLDGSPSAPADAKIPSRTETGTSPTIRERGLYREAVHFTPPGECLLAGRSIAPDLAKLRRFAWYLAAIGAGVSALGLVGGGWLASRAIQPIEDISGAAVKIAAGNLSHRINGSDTDTELGRLASVLNSTFARLEAAFSHQARFTADAAHELRTPVSVILSQTQTALSRERTTAEFRRTVEICQRAAQRMHRLIESLLELARFDAGQEPIRRVRFDLSETIVGCVEGVRPAAEERGIRIESDLPALDCVGDADRLAQVVTCLLNNALQYNREDGTVQVSARRRNGTVILSVSDTGEGIPPEELPHIFERFYRVQNSRIHPESGRTGLSLAIAKAIVTTHGGTIDISSQVGVGTTVTVRLPMESLTQATLDHSEPRTGVEATMD